MLTSDLATPAVCVDFDVLQANIREMAGKARQAGVTLRPHTKTHKSPAVAWMQLGAGATGITAAKVSEAEVMAAHGVPDIFIAYPVVGAPQITRLLDLAETTRIIVGCDSLTGLQALEKQAERREVILEIRLLVDAGNEREGVAPDELLALARECQACPHLHLEGIAAHEGHAYQGGNRAGVEAVAEQTGATMDEAVNVLQQNGIDLTTVSVGSTPSCHVGIPGKTITEWRPGTYVYNDLKEAALGVVPDAACALYVMTTVVSERTGRRLVLDAGIKVLTAFCHPEWGYGTLVDYPGAKIVRANEEHGIVEAPLSLPIGTTVAVRPVHVCPVVNLQRELYLVREQQVIGRIAVAGHACSV